MDISKIVVLVMVLIAVGFLAYFELNSRRNTRKQQQQVAAAQNDLPNSTDRGK